MEHLWVCPALAKEQMRLQLRINGILQGLPFALDKVRPIELNHRDDWLLLATKDPLCDRIPDDRLDALTRDFWNANKHKQFIPPQSFSKAVGKVLRKTYPQALSRNLLSMLIDLFCLNVEGKSNALQHYSRFEVWCSEDPDDKDFGALGSFLESDLSGKNTLAFPEFPDIEKAIRKAEEIINSPAPSRVIMFLPLNMEHKFLVIADLSECSIFQNQGPPSDISLVLAVNKESLVLDPIDWSLTCSHLKNWSKNIRIDSFTDALFRERSPINRESRASSLNLLTNSMRNPSSNVFSFHLPLSQSYDNRDLKSCIISSFERKAITKTNKHKFSLLALGILPNQLRRLLRPNMGTCESVLSELQNICFWGGYQIWRTRKALMKQVWDFMKPRKRKQRRKKNNENVSACRNPFHFLTKFTDFSHQKVTRCPCSLVETKKRKSAFLDIRVLFSQQPTQNTNITTLHHEQNFSPLSQLYLPCAKKQASVIRLAHFKPP
jgi:hypothetical protein